MDFKYLEILDHSLEGELYTDNLHKVIYATDASVYRELPVAVAYPKTDEDIRILIQFSDKHHISLIPRAAGTSLAGQCVGKGIVVDVSRYFTDILDFDPKERTVTVQPGVVRDELNIFLEPHGLFFSPNTSTSNRCMIGGMVANNSSGTTSIMYGVTRNKTIEIEGFLSDGSKVCFSEKTAVELTAKTKQNDLEGHLYREILDKLSGEDVKQQILEAFPKADIHRRNNGYAIDQMIKRQPFSKTEKLFNLCELLVGSEGTLVFMTKIKLKLDNLPPPQVAILTPHFDSVLSACRSVSTLMKHQLFACELMDKAILDCTKNNKLQAQNRSFIEGDPQAVLMLEIRSDSDEKLKALISSLLETINETASYYCPILLGGDINKANDLRKAGLGALGNMVGDPKAVACIEDTAVSLSNLADYMDEFSRLMEKHNQKSIYYAHAGAGEIHLRPILNLKKSKDVVAFRQITTEVATLVKKYKGSMSGEHGDGRARSEFIKLMLGDSNYKILESIKNAFDPKHIFNPEKIIDPNPMDTSLRYQVDREEPKIKTFMDFSDSMGILRASEKCNGSGDCRKTHLFGGAMCPSYQATRDEKDSTRARANALREFLTHSKKNNPFDHEELKSVMDLCIGCKSCLSECPSNVDMTALKGEFLYQYYKSNKRPLRDVMFAYNYKIAMVMSSFSMGLKLSFPKIITRMLGISSHRELPSIQRVNFKKRYSDKNLSSTKRVIFLIDEFSRLMDTSVVSDALELLIGLNYQVKLVYYDSARALISKGFLPQAKKSIDTTLKTLENLTQSNFPVLGIEPSAVLGFRDDYLRLASDSKLAKKWSKRVMMVEEFLWEEMQKRRIQKNQFTEKPKNIKVHLHCHQKVLSQEKYTMDILNLPTNYTASLLNTGCCGMAGAFGYEKEHYQLSMKIGGLKLFPAINSSSEDTILVANGTSCRHQISDGTTRKSIHPVSVLRMALKQTV